MAIRGLALLPHVRRLIELALDEDLGRGDVTTASTVGERDTRAVAILNARAAVTVFGLDLAAAVFALVDPRIEVEHHVADGARVPPGAKLLTARGPAAQILMAERTALNFAQRLSGVATAAVTLVNALCPAESSEPLRDSPASRSEKPFSTAKPARKLLLNFVAVCAAAPVHDRCMPAATAMEKAVRVLIRHCDTIFI